MLNVETWTKLLKFDQDPSGRVVRLGFIEFRLATLCFVVEFVVITFFFFRSVKINEENKIFFIKKVGLWVFQTRTETCLGRDDKLVTTSNNLRLVVTRRNCISSNSRVRTPSSHSRVSSGTCSTLEKNLKDLWNESWELVYDGNNCARL